jgi:hypothetical protein
MDEVLEKVLSSELLNEDTKNELLEAFKAELEKAKAVAVAEAEEATKVEFATRFAEDKANLIEALDTKITALWQSEIEELKEDIERFRDLEAEYATKLVEEKEQMSLQLQADMVVLANTLDSFIAEQLTVEFQELRESIEEVKQIEFGRKMFESMKDIFQDQFYNESDLAMQLKEKELDLNLKAKRLSESEKALKGLVREKEMNTTLSALHGRPREIMEAILKGVPTDKLAEAYDTYIGRVLQESTVEDKSEKETKVLAENASNQKVATVKTDEVLITGDTAEIPHTVGGNMLSESDRIELRRQAGLMD